MAGWIAAALVGAVFVVSGVAKLARPVLWRSQADALGVPAPIVAALPVIEVCLGALLVVQLARPVIAAVAIGVLAAFTVLLIVRLAQGRRPPCACFGSLRTRPIGPSDLARNAALIALALVAATA